MPNQPPDDQTKGTVSSVVPGSHKAALAYLADAREDGPFDNVTISSIGAEAIEEFLANHFDELPQEARDLLDDDLKANAGGDLEAEDVAEVDA